ncbi:MAG TPA: hypothetical protein VFY46_00735 [Acidimicrobiia bacterium]|nr:hypothetical protein [Acidimicrobiia bacterium]
MLKRLVAIGLVACVLVVTRAGEASACSCASLQPADALADFDAAFVGTLVASPSPMGGDQRSPYTFAVEKWVKGDLGTEVVVFAPGQGGACGFEAPVGERVGVFVTIEGETPTGSLCTMVDPDLLLAGDLPFELDGTGPPLFLVAGYSGRARLMLLDAEGGLLTMIGDEGENLHGLTTCPGSALFVEMVNDQLVVRSTADLSEIRRVDLQGLPFEVGVPRIWCRDPAAASLWVATDEWTEENGTVYRVVDADILDVPILEGEFGWVDLGADYAVAGIGPTAETILRIDLASKEETLLHKIPVDPGDSEPSGRGWVNPAGDRVVITQWRYRDGLGGSTTIYLYDLTTGQPLWQSPGLPTADGIGWVDDTKFLAYSYPDMNGDEVDNLMIDTETLEITYLADLPGYRTLRTGNQLVGVAGATLNVMSIATGEVSPVRVMPSETHSLVAVLDQTATVATTAPAVVTTTAPAASPEVSANPTDSSFPLLTWPGLLVAPIALGAIVSLALLNQRLRRRNTPD